MSLKFSQTNQGICNRYSVSSVLKKGSQWRYRLKGPKNSRQPSKVLYFLPLYIYIYTLSHARCRTLNQPYGKDASLLLCWFPLFCFNPNQRDDIKEKNRINHTFNQVEKNGNCSSRKKRKLFLIARDIVSISSKETSNKTSILNKNVDGDYVSGPESLGDVQRRS